jgi:hypothetical protein
MVRYNNNLECYFGISLVDDFTVRKVAMTSTKEYFEAIEACCKFIMRNPDPMIVPVLNFQSLEVPVLGSLYGTYKYQYDMKRLAMLEREEKDLIEAMMREYWSHTLDRTKNAEVLRGQVIHPKLFLFIKKLIATNRYGDLHSGNIMKDEFCNFQVIDLEGFITYPIRGPQNDWFRR